ncbi:proline dehydrogenase family protein [Paenibacillus sp. P25]|nr:proline dehydrogenase family protein [Paenibacillus sp. P25]
MDLGNRMFRFALLKLAGNRAVEAAALRYGLRLGAARFVAGETLEEAMPRVMELNRKRIAVTLDFLGEGISDLNEAAACKDEYLRLIDRIRSEGADANVSLKPTQMGLALSMEAAYANIREIARRAQDTGSFVRLDMENSPYTEATIAIAERLYREGFTQSGTVIQACLRRSENDVRRLTKAGMNLRLVKGAYKEPKPLVFPARGRRRELPPLDEAATPIGSVHRHRHTRRADH